MRRRVRWLIYMRKINILQTFCSGSSIGENVQFEDISISPSLTFYPLSSSETCMNKSNSPSSSRRDLLGRGPQQNHKIPPENFTIFLHMNTFTCKVEFLLCHAVAFCRDRENWAKFYYSQSISKVFTWNKLGGKTYTMSGRVKMIEGNRGGKGFGGKVVDRRFNASAKWGKHERK